MKGEGANSSRVSRALLICSVLALFIFWPLATVLLSRGSSWGLILVLFSSGLQGLVLGIYALARTDRRQWWRWIVLAVGGVGILTFSLVDAVNLDLHGFFELLLLGMAGAAIGHTMVTTIIGPLIFGRILCGWGCWRAMVLERLPVGNGSGRRKGVWVWTPLVGLAVSVAAAVLVALASDSRPGESPGEMRSSGLWSVAVGIVVYYAAAISLALALRDQRAFCKYLCPTGFILRWTSRHALLHVSARAEACNECDVCTEVCPMDIPVAARVKMGARIGDGDCILCQRCVESCPTGALKTSFRR